MYSYTSRVLDSSISRMMRKGLVSCLLTEGPNVGGWMWCLTLSFQPTSAPHNQDMQQRAFNCVFITLSISHNAFNLSIFHSSFSTSFIVMSSSSFLPKVVHFLNGMNLGFLLVINSYQYFTSFFQPNFFLITMAASIGWGTSMSLLKLLVFLVISMGAVVYLLWGEGKLFPFMSKRLWKHKLGKQLSLNRITFNQNQHKENQMYRT